MNIPIEQPILAAYLLSEAAARIAYGASGSSIDVAPVRPPDWFNYQVATWNGSVLERLSQLGSVVPESEAALVAAARKCGVTPVMVLVPAEDVRPWSHLPDVEVEYLIQSSDGSWADNGWLMRRMATPDVYTVTRWEDLRLGFGSDHLQTTASRPQAFWDEYAAGFSAWVVAHSAPGDSERRRWSWSAAWSRFDERLRLSSANAKLEHPQADAVRLRLEGYPFLQFIDRDRKFLDQADREQEAVFDRGTWGEWVLARGDLWGGAQEVFDNLLRRLLERPVAAMAAPAQGEERVTLCAGNAVNGIAAGTSLGWLRQSGKTLQLMLELPADLGYGSIRAELRMVNQSVIVGALKSPSVALNGLPTYAGVRSLSLELTASGEAMVDVQPVLLLVFDDTVQLRVSYAQ